MAVVAAVFSTLAVLAILPTSAWARRSGTGATGCDGCHSGGRPPTVTLTASPSNPAVGQVVTLTITVSQTNGAVAGFYLTTEELNAGTFRAIESGTLANSGGVTHTTPRTGSGGNTTFKVEWTATMAMGVQFAAYVLSANGDGASRGDAGGAANLSLVSGCTGATYYIDQDGDGFGSNDAAYPARKDCATPANYAPQQGDCNDFSPTVHPGASELCDLKDNNCNGTVDEAVVNQMYCEDKDGDGHGVAGAATKLDCAPSAGFGDCKGDCNDLMASVFPGGAEICDGRDNNCNGSLDEGVRKTCGVGWCRRYAEGCTLICTPGEPMVEACNYFDDDCDGVIDNGTDGELCGASAMVCVLGKCIADISVGDGGAPNGSDGGDGPAGRGDGGTGGGPSGGGGSAGGGCTVTGGGARAPTVVVVLLVLVWVAMVLLAPPPKPLSRGHRAR